MRENWIMGKTLKGMHTFLVLVSLVSVSVIVAQQPRRRGPAPAPAPKSDLRIKYRTNTGGQTMESITMLKGARERSETNTSYMNMVNIVQCDLKRTIQLSDNARKYVITPMETGDSSGSTPSSSGSSVPAEQQVAGDIARAHFRWRRRHARKHSEALWRTGRLLDSEPFSSYH